MSGNVKRPKKKAVTLTSGHNPVTFMSRVGGGIQITQYDASGGLTGINLIVMREDDIPKLIDWLRDVHQPNESSMLATGVVRLLMRTGRDDELAKRIAQEAGIDIAKAKDEGSEVG